MWKGFLPLLAALVLSLFLPGAASAALKLDRSFSNDGKVTTDFGSDQDGGPAPRSDRANAMAMDADGRLTLVGVSECGSGACGRMAALRYEPDGSLDRLFAEGGKWSHEYGEFSSVEDLAAFDTGGLQLVGRRSETLGAPSRMLLVRLDPDGQLDNSFSSDGLRTITIRDHEEWQTGLSSVGMSGNGDLVASGWMDCGADCHAWIIPSLQPDGTLSPRFRDGRMLTYTHPDNSDTPDKRRELGTSVAVDRFGRSTVVGVIGPGRVAVMRLRADGQLDETFNGSGFNLFYLPRWNSRTRSRIPYMEPEAVVVSPKGPIYVAAGGENEVDGRFGVLFRLRADGSMDTSFAKKKGYASTPDLAISDLAVDRCGRVVVGGTWSRGRSSRLGVMRYRSRGKPDKRFGGIRTVGFGKGRDATASSLDISGRRVFLGGWTVAKAGSTDFAAAALKMPRSAFRCRR